MNFRPDFFAGPSIRLAPSDGPNLAALRRKGKYLPVFGGLAMGRHEGAVTFVTFVTLFWL